MTDSNPKRDRVLKEALGCRAQLVAYAVAMLGNYSTAEDVVQEAMLVVVEKFDGFEEGTSILAWCRAIVRLEILRAKRQWAKEQSLADKLLDDAVDAAFEECQKIERREQIDSRRKALAGCLEKLPQRGRSVLQSRFVDQLSYQQIGERVEMKIEAVRKTLFRLKKQVRSCVATSLEGAQ